MSYVKDNLVIENARIIFRNFSGKVDKYNIQGQRNFGVIIDDPHKAEQLANDGWNVRARESKDEDEKPTYYIQVSVSYKKSPPKVVLISGKNRTFLDEESIPSLDYAEIINVDLIVNPYNWEIGNKTGVKGYLKTMYVTIEEDPFAEKYAMNDETDEPDLPF